MSVGLFNLDEVSDLPERLKLSLKKYKVRAKSKKARAHEVIKQMFDTKQILTIDEIMVGLFRASNLVRERSWVSAKIGVLVKEGFLSKEGNGVYKKA
jgi:hypothetical protein